MGIPHPRLQQSLSSLTAFTDYMRARGKTLTNRVLPGGLPVARVGWLRSADCTPRAIEQSQLPPDILQSPDLVVVSLRSVLRGPGGAPTRAVRRITAINLGPAEARLLNLPEGAAALRIEFTRGLYRSDIYDPVGELRQDGG